MRQKNRPYPYYDTLEQLTTLREMVDVKTAKIPNQTAFGWFEGDKEIKRTYREFQEDMEKIAVYLILRGFDRAHLALIGENSYKWLCVYMAIACTRNVAVVLDKDMPDEEILDVLERMDAKTIFASDALFTLKKRSGLTEHGEEWKSFSDLEKESDTIRETEPEKWNKAYETYKALTISPEDTASIFLTSGTTGKRKGVMLSHKNIMADINGSSRLFIPRGQVLVVLPFHHAFGLVVALWMVYNYEYPSYINSGLRRITKELALAKPQTMMMVPLFVETFHKQIWATARKQGKEKTLRTAMKISDFLLKFGIDLRKKFFKDIQNTFGGNLEFIICGGAPLDPMYVKEFRSFGVEILNGYGTTECSPCASVNRNDYKKDGTIGVSLPDVQFKVADDGEVWIKGDIVMQGYYKDPEATAAVLKDGWYATGDLGHIDEDGFITLTGRKKNLIILASGENVSPEELEEKLLRDPLIEEVIVREENGEIAAEIYNSQLSDETKSEIEKSVERFNKTIPMYKRITKIHFRDTEFEKTTTKKIKRS